MMMGRICAIAAGCAAVLLAQDANTCLEPEKVIRWEDYRGPMQSLEEFALKLDHTSDRKPAYKPGTVLCSLRVKERFRYFLEDSADPVSLIPAAFNAGQDHLSHRDPSFGQGPK